MTVMFFFSDFLFLTFSFLCQVRSLRRGSVELFTEAELKKRGVEFDDE